MKARIIRAGLVSTVTATALLGIPAVAANAQSSSDTRLNVALSLTKDSESSQTYWANMRRNKNEPYVMKYGFSWNTDGCSVPDELLNSKIYRTYKTLFKTACYRHDFGYRNVKHMVSSKNWKDTYKPRVDTAFHGDMKRFCGELSSFTSRTACKSLAYQFYLAAKFGGE